MPRSNALMFALGSAVALSTACSFSTKPGAGGVEDPNPSGFDAGAGVDRQFVGGEVGPITGDACPQNSFTANNLPPELLILLDRSGSMDQDAMGMSCQGGCGANSKWTLMTAAINQVVAQSEGTVNWGLKFFGSGNSGCTVNNTTAVPPATLTAAAIAAAIAAPQNQPATSTPTRAAELSAGTYMGGLTTPNPKYILLATDGEPNCAASGGNNMTDGPGAVAAVETVAMMGFPTFVIGIAADGEAGTTLSQMAVAGQRPRAGTPNYYSVSSTADLAAALTAIQSQVALPCSFQLGGAPSNPGAVSVSVGGSIVPSSSWTYGAGMRSIVFDDAGAICTSLKSGAVRDVLINLPCGETIIP